MNPIPEEEIHSIVQRVLRRTLGSLPGDSPQGQSAPPQIEPESPSPPEKRPPAGREIAIGADHGGFAMKEDLKSMLKDSHFEVIDCGTNSTEAVDYPDYALAVAQLVSQGKAWRGIMVDGAGIGSCMVANKLPGVRAAMCYDHATAINSREHNDANLLTLGAGLIAVNLARQIVKVWLETDLGGDRHARRVAKITAIEKQYLKTGS